MRPPFAYYGGKVRIASQIADLLPVHAHYVEPFGGSLAVLLAKPPSKVETVNDLDQDLMTFWRVLRDRPLELERMMRLTPHSRAEYRMASTQCASDELEVARRTWVQLTQSRGGGLRGTGWRHFQSRSNLSMPGYLRSYCDRVAPVVERLAGVSLECRPALDVIASYGRHANVLLYVDPPYLASTRNSVGYRHEMQHEPEHRELAEALHACAAKVVLSGYHSDLYGDLYADWHVTTIDTWTGNASDPGVNGARTEVLWSNCPLGQLDLFGGVAS